MDRGLWVLRELVSSARHSFPLPAFAMPDHLHFLATANSSASDLAPFVSAFKQRTGYRYLKACRGKLWQPQYYEHILREAEDLQGSCCTYGAIRYARRFARWQLSTHCLVRPRWIGKTDTDASVNGSRHGGQQKKGGAKALRYISECEWPRRVVVGAVTLLQAAD